MSFTSSQLLREGLLLRSYYENDFFFAHISASRKSFAQKKIAPINSISITKALKGTNEFGEIQVSLSELE